MDSAYRDFVDRLAQIEGSRCSDDDFLALSREAVRIYGQRPELGEKLAYLMTGIWVTSESHWRGQAADHIGQLFADLDVPPHHVVGGEMGAAAKWEAIERLSQGEKRSGG